MSAAPSILKAAVPIAKTPGKSAYSISAALDRKEEIVAESQAEIPQKDLPASHFSEVHLQEHWQEFLESLKTKDLFVYNAVQHFKLNKIGENIVEISYSSETSKAEFDKIKNDFFNFFKHKVNNYKIETVYRTDLTLKKEVLTKRKIFDKFVEVNPLLKDLDDLLKFDLS